MSHETMMTNALKRVVDLIASDPDRLSSLCPSWADTTSITGTVTRRPTSPSNWSRSPALGESRSTPRLPTTPTRRTSLATPYTTRRGCSSANAPRRKEIRDSVARHELIACNEDLTVHVSKVDMGRQSWCLGQFRCNSIAPLSAAVPRGAVAVHVFEQGPLRTAIAHATQNEPGSADKRVFDFAETLRATYLESPTEPIWVIYGRPFTKDHASGRGFATSSATPSLPPASLSSRPSAAPTEPPATTSAASRSATSASSRTTAPTPALTAA
ncbi:hypothetical protein B0H14DRAFT_491505 [Mycena olivaceomarginata]|nr:hypothetical protein B0H14DRAFT_491505 [Mycena olivaceomarginata]